MKVSCCCETAAWTAEPRRRHATVNQSAKLATELGHANGPLCPRERKPGGITGITGAEREQAAAPAGSNLPHTPVSAPLRLAGLPALLTDQRRRIPSLHICQERYWDLTESLPDV